MNMSCVHFYNSQSKLLYGTLGISVRKIVFFNDMLWQHISLKRKYTIALSTNNIPNSKHQTVFYRKTNITISKQLANMTNTSINRHKEDVEFTSTSPKSYNCNQNHLQSDQNQPSIFLFPGEGSQFVGMGKKLITYPLVKHMYEVASEIVKFDVAKICFEGPESELWKTVYCQPAVLVTSLAAVQKIKAENPKAIENCISAIGFGVGEFAALVFAGGISFEDAVRIVKVRAEAMQAAADIVEGGMMKIICRRDTCVYSACVDAIDWCKKLGIEKPECDVAFHLHDTIKVIAGNEKALQFIRMNAKEYGIRHCQSLKENGAFYSNLMLPAEGPVQKILENTKINLPIFPVHSNVYGKKYKNINHIRQGLVEQMSNPIKWQHIILSIYPNPKTVIFPYTYVCGPGNYLKAILKKVNVRAYDCCESVNV